MEDWKGTMILHGVRFSLRMELKHLCNAMDRVRLVDVKTDWIVSTDYYVNNGKVLLPDTAFAQFKKDLCLEYLDSVKFE